MIYPHPMDDTTGFADNAHRTSITCHVCNGEGYVNVFAYNGDQTEFTALCPNCAGFGRVGRDG